jgi:hypothetical protein
MDNDKKTKVVKFFKIMVAYFGLYLIHFVIIPNTPLYINSHKVKYIQGWTYLLFPIVDILLLNSNIAYGFIGVLFYSFCVYVYSANGAYGFGLSGLFNDGSFDREALLFHLKITIVLYMIFYLIFYIIIRIIRFIKDNPKN